MFNFSLINKKKFTYTKMTLIDKVLVDLENAQTENIDTISRTLDEVLRLKCTFGGKKQEVIRQKKLHWKKFTKL